MMSGLSRHQNVEQLGKFWGKNVKIGLCVGLFFNEEESIWTDFLLGHSVYSLPVQNF